MSIIKSSLVKTGLVSSSLVKSGLIGAGDGGGSTPGGSMDDTILALNPKAYYLLDEPYSSTVAYDASPNGLDANYSNTPALGVASIIASDPATTAMHADVGWGRLSGIGPDDLDVNVDTPFSLVLPFKVNNTTNHFQQLALLKSTRNEPFSILINQSFGGYSLGFSIGSQNDWGQHELALASNYRQGPDTCVAIFTYDGAGTFKIYIEGVAGNVIAGAPFGPVSNPPNSNIPNHVNSANSDAFVDYTFQKIAYFDFVLTPAQALSIYESSLA